MAVQSEATNYDERVNMGVQVRSLDEHSLTAKRGIVH
jgi:hypothetical protein